MSDLPSPELLEEIIARFILSSGDKNLESFERLLFLVEEAWWYYEVYPRKLHTRVLNQHEELTSVMQDYVRDKPQNKHLRSFQLKEFLGLLFDRCPGLGPFKPLLEEIYQNFNKYKRAVPVRGAILLDPTMEKCLLVRGWKKEASWGFPRGKTSYGETDVECAIREVLEETGYNIQDKLKEEDFVEAMLKDQDTKLFIIQDVEESTHFAPHVRCEIGAFAWHLIDHLPSTPEEGRQAFVNDGGSRHRFFNVWPYVKPLRNWIFRYRKQLARQQTTKLRRTRTSRVELQDAPFSANSLISFTLDKGEILKQIDCAFVS